MGSFCYNDGMSDAHIKAVAKYNAKNYEKLSLRLRKDEVKELREYLNGRSMNGFINDAIREKMERERSEE